MTEQIVHQIPLKEQSPFQQILLIVMTVALPLYFVTKVDELDYAKPELMKGILIFGSLGTLIAFLYSKWYANKMKIENKNIAIEITNFNLKILYPKENSVVLNNITKAYWKDDEINKNKVFLELKESKKEKILEIDTENINLKPYQLCKLINQSL